MVSSVKRDTVPRLHRIVEHTRDQLRGIAEGDATFEACRVRYGNTQQRLSQNGLGRVTAPPPGVSEKERNWAPTRDCLSELMRLEAVENKPLPSSRAFVDRYRAETYELTEIGENLAQLTSDGASFVDALSQSLIAAHPYLRTLLLALEEDSIRCPTVSESDVERPRGGTRGWAEWARERIGGKISVKAIEQEIDAHLTRRFGNPPTERPSNKALSDTMDDAFMVAAFAAREVNVDVLTLKTLLSWGSELLLYDRSRYVPDHPDTNVIWLAADLARGTDGGIHPARRGVAAHEARVSQAFWSAYKEQASESRSSLEEPYLPVHQLRAQVAYKCGVTRALCDMVLSKLADGYYQEVEAEVSLHIGVMRLPVSEPAFRHHGRRRLEVTMRTKQRSDS